MQHLLRDEDVTITLFHGMAGLESLKDAWNEIVSGMNRRHFFHLWEWHFSYLKCLEPDPQSFQYFLFTKEKMPVAIFPLRVTHFFLGGMKLRALAPPFHSHMLLGDLICNKDALHLPLFQLFSEYLRNQNIIWDVIQLPRLLEDTCAMQVIRQHPPARFALSHDGRCDFMDTTGEYDIYFSRLSKRLRRSLKRASKHLDQLPGVEFTFTNKSPKLEEKLDVFLDVEASGWKGAHGIGSAIKLNANLECFYQTIVSTLSASGKVSINTLSTDSKCIAAQLCLLLDNTAYILKFAYDEAYKHYAPGYLLLDHFMKRSIEDCTIESINLISDAEWYVDWMPKSYNKYTIFIFNASPAGLIGFVILKSIQIFKKQYQAYIKPHLSRRIQEWIVGLSHET